MKTDATSLDRLHDLVLPPLLPWWPRAPGWYVLLALLSLAVVWISWRYWKRWRANAYRREALRQLKQFHDVPAIALLLRRTALAVAPRSEIAAKTGSAWADWLAGQCPESMDPEVKKLLSFGVYGLPGAEQDVRLLRNYAACWITHYSIFNKNLTETPGE
jgi:hypothetical protein